MSDTQIRALEAFPQWLKSLGGDALELGRVLGEDATPDAARKLAAGALNYLFKSLDLIPDGIEDLGYLDDAFVLRLAAHLAVAESGAWARGESAAPLRRLGEDAALIREFLGAVYPRLERYVRELVRGGARGRSTEDIVSKADVREAFVGEVRVWADAYQTPSFTKDPKTLVKLASFLDTKLPA